MKASNRIWFLMARKLSGSILPEEQIELEDLLAADPELWYSFEMLEAAVSLDDIPEDFILQIRSLLERASDAKELEGLIGAELGKQAPGHKNAQTSRKLYWVPALLAAFVILATWFGIGLVTRSSKTPGAMIAMNEVFAPKGSKYQLKLADGTIIWLNAGSHLRYPKDFSLRHREVFLEGEAYFKVKHNDRYSFVVHTSDADIKDLGTTFNVKAYGATTETTLIEGSVEITLKRLNKKIRLEPNHKAVFRNEQKFRAPDATSETGQAFEIEKLVPFKNTRELVETAWVSDKMIFRDVRFEDLMNDMERRYNVSIEIKAPDVKDLRVTGTFTNESVDDALKILTLVAPFNYRISNEKVVIEK